MPRLIDADELKNKAMMIEDYGSIIAAVTIEKIDESPTIDPTIHAQWVEESGTIVCSDCHHKRNTADREYTMYCGHCGAKMEV